MSCKIGTVDLANVVQQTATEYGVDPSIALAVAQRESGVCQYRSNGSLVVSSAGAIGVMQLLPSTALDLGVDEKDPYQNIQGGVRYLAQMFSMFGNWPLALAAYNWGPARVSAALAAGQSLDNFPASVQSYVAVTCARCIINRAGTTIFAAASGSPPSGISSPLPSFQFSPAMLALVGTALVGLWIAVS